MSRLIFGWRSASALPELDRFKDRLYSLMNNSILFLLLGGATLQCVRENSFSSNLVERSTAESSPGRATKFSPPLQRWESKKK